MRSPLALAIVLMGRDACAHGAPETSDWGARLLSWSSLAALGLLRPRRRVWFWAAMGALLPALVWPLEQLAQTSLAAHMLQHMLVIAVAAPMLVASRPALPWLKGMRAAGVLIRTTTQPAVAFVLHALAIWVGHTPWALDAAARHPLVHLLEHALLLGTAVLLWWSLRQGGARAAGNASLWTLGTMIHTSMLGALLTFAPRLLFPGYTLEDQQLAGLVMWVPGGLLYLAAALSFAGAWLGARTARA